MTEGPDNFRDFELRGWEKAADEYHQRFGQLTSQCIEPLLDAVDAQAGIQFLDAACGPGYVTGAAARRGCLATGIDFSSNMVALARRNFPTLDFREGDAEQLHFPDNAFDAVVMNFGMLHLGAPERAIAEAFRVLRNGGRYAFTVWEAPERAIGLNIVLTAIQHHGDIHVPLPPGPPFFRFSDAAKSRRTMESAGFENVQVRSVAQFWNLKEGADLFTAFRDAAVRTAALLNHQDPAALDRIREEIAAQAKTYRQGDSILLPMPAVLVSASRP